MANTAALLGTLLTTKADISYYQQQEMYWNAKYECNSEKLSKQVKYEEKWESAYDSAMGNTSALVAGGVTVGADNKSTSSASMYANAKVKKYNKELSCELADLDVEYDTMKTMYESLITALNAKKDNLQGTVQTAAQDTGMGQGGA